MQSISVDGHIRSVLLLWSPADDREYGTANDWFVAQLSVTVGLLMGAIPAWTFDPGHRKA